MGARIALEAFVQHGAPFKSLTCLSTTLSIAGVEKRKEQEALWIKKLKDSSIKEFVKFWYGQNLFNGFSIPKTRFQQNKDDLTKVLQEYSILKTNISSIDQSLPIRFLYRRGDPKALKAPNPRFIAANNHAILLENPSACARSTQQFIDSL